MLLTALLALVLLCSVGPAVLFRINLRLYREPPPMSGLHAHVAVLIPARNEEENLAACVQRVLASAGVRLDVFVLDDNSTDGTAAIAAQLADTDARVHVLGGAPLHEGWNGKQFACAQLAQAAEPAGAPLLLFLDADVRLAPDAIARMARFQQASGAALVSGFPRQITVTALEWLLLPLIHFVLLGFLPLHRMRRSASPAYAAGCGQFLLAERMAYVASGGHAAIRQTRHDGLLLPRLLRAHGYRTDLADLTRLAEVRMYGSGSEVWTGLAKNATEGIAAPARIVPFTLLLLLGQVVPATLFAYVAVLAAILLGLNVWLGMGVHWVRGKHGLAEVLTLTVAVVASYLPRVLAAKRFRQLRKSVWLHPVGVVVLLVLQWYALVRQLMGKPVSWRARLYASDSGAEHS